MSDQVLLIEHRPPFLILTLNRPEVRNALNSKLIQELELAIDEAPSLEDLRALLITGGGDKAFCAGADLKERLTMSETEVRSYLSAIRRLLIKIEELPLPVIAVINGFALGGGTELALACDLRIAVTNATLGLTETRFAIIPGAGGTQRLPRLIGVPLAKELIYTGRQLSAQEALAKGLVNRLAARSKLMEVSLELAGEIAKAGPIAVTQAKFAINNGQGVELHTGLAIEASAYETCIPTEDRREGLKAFAEKRQPVYQGR
ncbi:MAG: enoyl-CoA hydratase-related protein [Deltaproteobacteria bacterium]|jgi:enoyl-CoA hydratase/carnithine racemase